MKYLFDFFSYILPSPLFNQVLDFLDLKAETDTLQRSYQTFVKILAHLKDNGRSS